MTNKKRWVPWVIGTLVVALVGLGVGRAVSTRQAQQKALAAAAAAPVQVALKIAPDEVWRVQRQKLALGVAVSGTLRAVHSATIKARVAGELQGLTLREGDQVQAGQEVARIDAVEMQARLRQAQQQADAAHAQVDINQRQFNNNQALVNQGFISRTALETSQASLQAAQSSHQAALAAADVARKGLADTVLRSPLSGQVAQRLAQNGERVGVEARILEVVDLSRMEVEALLGPADSVAVRVGQVARLHIEGNSDTLTATVARISPSAQVGSRAVPVYLTIDATQKQNPATSALRQGLFVQGTLEIGTSDLLAVPLDTIRTDQPAPYVQVSEQGHIVHKKVKTGARSIQGGQTLVAIEGVPEGALVLAGRVGALPEGTVLDLAPATTHP